MFTSCAKTVAAALLWVVLALPASADDYKHVEFELTTDVTSQGGYWVNSRTLIAPFTDLDTSSFRLAINGIKGGGRHHNGETDEIDKYEFTSADFMVGYAVERDNLSMKFLMGANVADYLLSVPDPTNPMQGTQLGVKFSWELDSEPVKYNMLYAKASYSTAFNTYYAQLQYGYDFTCGSELYVGPELIALGHRNFTEYRLGVHLTEIKLGKVNVGLSGGARLME